MTVTAAVYSTATLVVILAVTTTEAVQVPPEQVIGEYAEAVGIEHSAVPVKVQVS